MISSGEIAHPLVRFRSPCNSIYALLTRIKCRKKKLSRRTYIPHTFEYSTKWQSDCSISLLKFICLITIWQKYDIASYFLVLLLEKICQLKVAFGFCTSLRRVTSSICGSRKYLKVRKYSALIDIYTRHFPMWKIHIHSVSKLIKQRAHMLNGKNKFNKWKSKMSLANIRSNSKKNMLIISAYRMSIIRMQIRKSTDSPIFEHAENWISISS